ncbi:MAG: hypothetical protein ACXABK_04150 [Candidatus Heimdallarchaeaceae archaeon]
MMKVERNKGMMAVIIATILTFSLFAVNISYAVIDYRDVSFNNKGYDIEYEIIQGENIDDMFENLGFDLSGSLSQGSFHVILKNRKTELRDIYLIESDKFLKMEVPYFSMTNYVVLSNQMKLKIDTSSEFLRNLIGFNYEPVSEEVIEITTPVESAIDVPSIFTNLTRPNFGALMVDINYFDFLPVILGEDYDRYEAEFTTLLLNQSFTVNIYNQGYDEFTIALDADIDPAISLRASWDKTNGVLTSLSLHITYGERTSVLSPIDIPVMHLFITNSSSSYMLIQHRNSTQNQLENWSFWVNQLNQTEGLRYLFYREGLEFDWNLYVYDDSSGTYTSSSPIHSFWISFIPPVLIPVWKRYEGMISLIEEVWQQLKETLVGYQFTLSGVTSSLYTLRDMDFRIEYQLIDNVHHLIWDFSFDYQSNNTQVVVPRIAIQEISMNMSGWLAYSEEGILEGFSIDYQEHYYSYYDPPETDLGNNYYYEYYLESAENITQPTFVETEKTSFPFKLEQIIFYSVLIYAICRKRRRRRKKRENFAS